MGPPLTSGNVRRREGAMTLTLTPVGGNRMILSNIQLDPDTTMTQAQVERLAALYNLTQAEIYDRAQSLIYGPGPLMRSAYLQNPMMGYGAYPAEEYDDVETDAADAAAHFQNLHNQVIGYIPPAVTVTHLPEEEYDMDAELELAMDEALAQYNAQVDMGNDPVGSGQNLGLRHLSDLDAALLPPVPESTGYWPWLGLVLALFAFWYLFF